MLLVTARKVLESLSNKIVLELLISNKCKQSNSTALLKEQKVVDDTTEVANTFFCYIAIIADTTGAPYPVDEDDDTIELLQT